MSHYSYQTFSFVLAAYIILSGIFLALFFVLFPKYFSNRFETLVGSKKGRSLLVASLVVSIGISFFLFKISFGFYEFNWVHAGTGVLALGSFLVFPLGFLRWVDEEPKPNEALEEKGVDEKTSEPDLRVTISEKAGRVDLNQVLYIYSEKNYVVWVCLQEGIRKEFRVRETISSVEERLAEWSVIKRCHRAYLVNTKYAGEVLRFGSTFQLQLLFDEEKIPLSRKLVLDFRK